MWLKKIKIIQWSNLKHNNKLNVSGIDKHTSLIHNYKNKLKIITFQ
jgi:hypothetical protein